MFFQKQLKLDKWSCSVLILLILTTLTVNMSNAQQRDESARSYMIKIEKSTPREVYNTLSASAMHAFMKHLTDPSDTQALEKLVMMCNVYIAKYPSSGQLKEVNYYLGTALVRLGEFQKGVPILERLVETISPDYIAVTQFNDVNRDRFKWNLTERVLLELGLTYDKQEKHNKADAVYNKLVTHPKFVGGLPARIARHILELDTTLRIGEIPTTHNAWVGKTAPNFGMGFDENKKRVFSLNRYKGHVVLLRFDTEDTNRHNLIQLHDKYKNQKFQIITVNPVVSDPPMPKSVEMKGEAWIHYQDKHGKFVNMYQIRNSPVVFLIDSEGVIQKTDLDHTTLEKAVDDLVKENLDKYNDPRTQAIITKTVNAHGGFEKLQAVNNIVLNSNIFEHESNGSVSEEVTLQMILFHDKVYQTYLYNDGQRNTRIYDGTSIYDIEGTGKIVQLDEQYEKYQIRVNKDFLFTRPIWLLTALAQNEIPIEYLGTENVDGESATVLRVQIPSGELVKIYINNLTNYIVRLVAEEDGVNRVMTFRQHKDVDGLKLSHYWIEKQNSHYEYFINRIYINAEIDPKLFDPNFDVNKGVKLPYVEPKSLSEKDVAKTKEIIAKTVEAHGGLEKIQAIENIVMDYTRFVGTPDNIVSGPDVHSIIYRDKYFQNHTSKTGQQFTTIFDGTSLYLSKEIVEKTDYDHQLTEIMISENKDWLFKIPIWLLTTLAQNEIPIEYVGTESVNGEPANVLCVNLPSGTPIKIYINKKTNYIVRIMTEQGTRSSMNTSLFFEQYKDVDGIKFSHHWIDKQQFSQDIRHVETSINRISFNTQIDPKLFDPNSDANKVVKLPYVKPKNLSEKDVVKTKEIVKKAVAAHGGLKKLKAVENIVVDFGLYEHQSNDAVALEKTGQIILYRNKHYQDIVSKTGEKNTRIFDGTSVYNIDVHGNIVNFDSHRGKQLISYTKDWLFKMPIWLLTTLAQNEIPIEYIGTENVNGEPATVLKVEQPSKRPLRIYISERTNYIVQLKFNIFIHGESNEVALTFDQYKDIDGIKMPHYWVEIHHIQKNHFETHSTQNEIFLNKIRFNVEINPKLFDPNSVKNKYVKLSDVKLNNLTDNDETKIKNIVTKAVEAHGGSEKLQTVKNMVRDYSLFIALPDGTLHKYGGGKAYLYPNKYRSDFHSTDGGNYKMMSDGKNIYFADGNTFGKLDDDEAKIKMKQDKDMAFREPIWLLKTLAESKTPVEYVGIENVKDEPASVLRVKQPSGIPIKIYISSKTHYLVKIVIEDETDKTVKLFKVFKDVDGIILPHQSISITEEEHHETHFSNATINAIIDPILFDPQELKK